MKAAGSMGVPLSAHQISERQMKRYFTGFPLREIISVIIGILLLYFGFSSHSLLVLIGLICVLIGGGIIALRVFATPSDEQFDEWLKDQSKAMLGYAINNKLNLDRSELIRPPLQLHGFILPGTKAAVSYRKGDVRMKKGKDGKWRFSVNIYTFFFPADRFLAIYVGEINVFNQLAHHDKAFDYFYNHIVGLQEDDIQDEIVLRGTKHQYRIQALSLHVTDGSTISTAVSAKPIDNKQPTVSIPDPGIDQTINQLRMILRSKKGI